MKLGYFIRIAENNQSTLLEGETRNGCYVCPFVQSCRRSKDAETRCQRLKRFYPPKKQYACCMWSLEEDGLEMKLVLNFLEIRYE